MLSLAKVLALAPRLALFDELSLGLAPRIVDEVFDALAAIRGAGTSLLVVEQHLDRVLSMADRAVVLVRGRVAAEGSVADVQPAIAQLLPARPAGRRAGREAAPAPPAAQHPGGVPEWPDAE